MLKSFQVFTCLKSILLYPQSHLDYSRKHVSVESTDKKLKYVFFFVQQLSPSDHLKEFWMVLAELNTERIKQGHSRCLLLLSDLTVFLSCVSGSCSKIICKWMIVRCTIIEKSRLWWDEQKACFVEYGRVLHTACYLPIACGSKYTLFYEKCLK